jgi:hypothetical protein
MKAFEHKHKHANPIAWLLCLAALCLALAQGRPCLASPDQLCAQDVDGLIKRMLRAYDGVDDYTTIFLRRGVHAGEEELCPKETILLKFRKPLSLYMKWIEDPKKGREVIYVKGWNQGLFRISLGTFPYLTMNLDPKGVNVKNESFGHTLLEAGIGHMVEVFANNLRKGLNNPQDSCKVLDLGVSQVHGEKVRCLENLVPLEMSHKYYAPRAVLCVSLSSNLPVQARVFNQFGELIEEFGFMNTKTNVGLTDKDFDPKNPEYDF